MTRKYALSLAVKDIHPDLCHIGPDPRFCSRGMVCAKDREKDSLAFLMGPPCVQVPVPFAWFSFGTQWVQ